MAREITGAMPSVRKVRMVNSGTEATLSAIRLARGATGRARIVKMEGCYHGHVDALLVSAGSGGATLGIPGTPGVPQAVAAQTSVVPYNALDDPPGTRPVSPAGRARPTSGAGAAQRGPGGRQCSDRQLLRLDADPRLHRGSRGRFSQCGSMRYRPLSRLFPEDARARILSP